MVISSEVITLIEDDFPRLNLTTTAVGLERLFLNESGPAWFTSKAVSLTAIVSAAIVLFRVLNA